MNGVVFGDKMGKVNAWHVVACLAVVAAALVLLGPIFCLAPRIGTGNSCQSNMNQIGRALKLYLSEWNGNYPTNRPYLRRGKLGYVAAHVKITPAADGHVKTVGVECLTKKCRWDAEDRQWYNVLGRSDPKRSKTIAITP